MHARIDNITDTALYKFQAHYGDNSITKDDLFHYVYGILHSPKYKERFSGNLTKEMPRVPFAPDFFAFVDAGHQLMDLHVGYETCEEYPLTIEGELTPENCRMSTRPMRFKDKEKKAQLIVSDNITLTGIPPEAHEHLVNGKTPLGWLIDRYQIKKNPQSGITNDPNEWFDDPLELISSIRRAIYLTVETVRIVKELPDPFPPEDEDHTGK